jgi:ADP-ribosylglycohydrolase
VGDVEKQFVVHQNPCETNSRNTASAATANVMIAFHNAFRHLASGTPIEDALVETVGEGGDTDTNAAICEALLGAAQGRAAIPVRWSMAVLACGPLSETGARQPRLARSWPDDVPLLAEALLSRARYSH